MEFSLKVDDEIELRLAQESFSKEIFQAIDKDRDHLRPWLPWVDLTKTSDNTLDFTKRAQKQAEEGNGFQFSIFYQGKIVGALGQHDLDNANKKTSIGYWLNSDVGGKGIMHKACARFIEYIFTEQGVNRIALNAAVDNMPSQAVAKRLGFKEEGISREVEWNGDRVLDHVNFSLLKSEWKK